MASFSSILGSIGQPKQTPQQPTKPQPSGLTNGTNLQPTNTAAGVKRKSEEPQSGPPSSAAPPSKRFQLGSNRQPQAQRPSTAQPASTKLQPPGTVSKPTTTTKATPTPPATANGPPPASRGFASILAKAKAAQQAAAASGPTTIKHQPTKHLSKRERRLAAEEAKAAQRSGGKSGTDRSRSNTPIAGRAGGVPKGKATADAAGKGAVTVPTKKERLQLNYKGTMRANSSTNPDSSTSKPQKKKPLGGRHDGYASWSELDDASDGEVDDDEEGGYGSDGSSDMEGGFDDMQREEVQSRRIAQKEDEEALEEEERLRREKEARRKRLEGMNKAAAGKKKY